jgi:hypothetical protein
MSRKFIKQVDNQNFIYPNNFLAEYDTELVQDINEYSVSGTVVSLSATTVSSTGITFNLNYTWSKNGAETWIDQSGNMPIVSVHMMAENQLYYKPWRLVRVIVASSTGSTTQSGTNTFSVTPLQLGTVDFDNGTYNFEVRFIGHRAIYPVCQSVVVSGIIPPITPTPTPVTPTPTPVVTVTPTPTPAISYTSGATLNVTDTGWIKYNMSSGSTYQFIGSTGTVTLTNCLDCDTIMEGIPFADLAVFTVTNCGSSCSPGPTPTPTPTLPPGSQSLQLYLRDIDGSNVTTLFYSKNGGGNINVPGATGTFLPTSCTLIYTISGLTTGDIITFGTSVNCGMEGAGGTSCPSYVSSLTTYSYVVDITSVQTLSLTVDTGYIP